MDKQYEEVTKEKTESGKLRSYKINYSFDGYGVATVKAHSEEEAREIFDDEDCKKEENEWSECTEVLSVEITK